MPLSFPSNPSVGQQSTENGRTYQWSGYAWEIVASSVSLDASQITSGVIATARLGTGTANSTTYLRGDGTWASAGSTSASDLTSGTLADARLSANARQAIDNLIHPFLLAGM